MQHPRRNLSFTCSRRNLWRALLQEVFVIRGSVKGGQGRRLSELGSLPDDQLAQVRPIMNPDCEILVDQGHLWGRFESTEVTVKLFPTEKENLAAFNLFNGRHRLGEIGSLLAQEMGWDEVRAFTHARDLFLSLVSRLVCVPKDPPAPDQ